MSRYWFISTKHRHGSQLALCAFLLAFVVIMLGAFTRLTDAGLSCPDWPHCYGYLTAPHTQSQIQQAAQTFPATPVNTKKAWTEMVHRYAAGTEGILILWLASSILSSRRASDTKSRFIAIALIALLGVQVALGMFTVTEKLKPVIVLSHLLTGISILSVLWWAYLDVHLHDDSFLPQQSSSFLYPALWLALLVVFFQITLGGWVSTHYAGLACVDFPYCNGQILPALQWDHLNSDLITIHMLHRIGAMITACYIAGLALCLVRHQAFRSLGCFMLAILGLQITLGILNILWLRPVWMALLHQSVGIILLLTVMTALIKSSFITRQRYGF